MNGTTPHAPLRPSPEPRSIPRLLPALVLVSCALAHAPGQGVCFGPGETTWSVNGATGVDTGDVDGDGRPDVLLGGGSAASWVRNLGQGSFGGPIPVPTLPFFQANAEMRAIDFDGDGDADVVYAGRIVVGICENLGGGDFADGVALAVHADVWTQDLEPVDLDGDGDVDVAFSWTSAATGTVSQVAWVENLCGLGFGPVQVLHASASPTGRVATHAVDLEGDGDADLLAMTPDGLVALRNLGAGAFAPALVLEPTTGTTVTGADVDGDGDQDVIAFHSGSVGLRWYENLGGPSWPGILGPGQPIATIAGVFEVEAADLDGDGDPDLVTNGGDRVVLYDNLGGAAFGAGEVLSSTSTNSRSLALADMHQNGRVDVLYAAWSADKIALMRNQARGVDTTLTFSQPVPGGLDVSIACGYPNHLYFTVFTTDPANANGGLGSGWWGGLHISAAELTALLALPPAPPIQGTLDGSGASFFSFATGFSGATGLTLYANVTTLGPGQPGLSAQSDPIAYTFQ